MCLCVEPTSISSAASCFSRSSSTSADVSLASPPASKLTTHNVAVNDVRRRYQKSLVRYHQYKPWIILRQREWRWRSRHRKKAAVLALARDLVRSHGARSTTHIPAGVRKSSSGQSSSSPSLKRTRIWSAASEYAGPRITAPNSMPPSVSTSTTSPAFHCGRVEPRQE